jgi:hypothetical protein
VRVRLGVCVVLAVALSSRAVASGAPVSAGLDDAGYLRVADALVSRIEVHWDDRLQRYQPGAGGTITETNADLLLVHAVAALAGHQGRSRNDARARAIARFLTSHKIWHGGSRPGWKAAPNNIGMHVVFEAEAAEGLATAYIARDALRLDPRTVQLIQEQYGRCSPPMRR